MDKLKEERKRLMRESYMLNGLSFGERDKHKTYKLKQIQTEIYKKWKFYDGYIKAKESLK